MSGCETICGIASAAIVTKNSIITGPKNAAILAVPWLWTRKSARMIAKVIGRMYGSSLGVTSFRPSTAERTEIAGVIMASP